MPSPSLPDPDQPALERSRRLQQVITHAIEQSPERVIGFDRFMALALYTPQLGYYTAPQAIFGRAGDFVTAPESGDLFGACLSRSCADILQYGGDQIIEYGAGSGALAVTLLTSLKQLEALPTSYHIVEPSAELRARQQHVLAELADDLGVRLSWSEHHREVPCSGVIIANEVLDAMPAKRYRVEPDQVVELGVGISDGEFDWSVLEQAEVPAQLNTHIAAYQPGYCCEVIVGLEQWLAAVRRTLSRGAVLLCDYGYPAHELLHPDRSGGTLKCHYKHHMHSDPFLHPGLQDLTTSVNFTALAELADDAGFKVAGYTSQAHFLLACGIESMIADAAGDSHEMYALANQAKRLLLPGEMGQTCKFIALTVDHDAPLVGFANDERHRLSGFS